ncbi:MAG TPA: hypothetical protein VGD37_33490, partial [Kofleriaceae bacterium]
DVLVDDQDRRQPALELDLDAGVEQQVERAALDVAAVAERDVGVELLAVTEATKARTGAIRGRIDIRTGRRASAAPGRNPTLSADLPGDGASRGVDPIL